MAPLLPRATYAGVLRHDRVYHLHVPRMNCVKVSVREHEGARKPPRRASQYDYFCIMIQLGRLPPEKVRPLFDDTQWQALNRQVAQYKGMEPQLKEAGLLAYEDDEADGTDAPGTARKN